MAGRASSSDLAREQARQQRKEQARQLQAARKEQEEFQTPCDLFDAPIKATPAEGDTISVQARRAMGEYSPDVMTLFKGNLLGVDQQPMTPIPDQRAENPLSTSGKGSMAKKDLFNGRKSVGYNEYKKRKGEFFDNAQKVLSKNEKNTVKNESVEKIRQHGDKSQTHQRRSSKDLTSHSVSHGTPQNQITEKNHITKPHGSRSHSPSPVKKSMLTTSPSTYKKEDRSKAKNNNNESQQIKSKMCLEESQKVRSKTSHEESKNIKHRMDENKHSKDVPPTKNGMVVNGLLRPTLKPKHPPNLPKLDIKEAQYHHETTDVESILKEMTRPVCAPLTAIQTPRKEVDKFPFPSSPPKKPQFTEASQSTNRTDLSSPSGVNVVVKEEIKKRLPATNILREEVKKLSSPVKVNHVKEESRELTPPAKVDTIRERQSHEQENLGDDSDSESRNVSRPTSKLPVPSGHGGGANAPMKEPRTVSSSESSDESSDNENESSGESNEDSSSSSDEESEKEVQLPKRLSPLISPPVKHNESNSSSSSWALSSLINHFGITQSPITPLSTSGSSRNSDKKSQSKSPRKDKDENDEMLSKLITGELEDSDDNLDVSDQVDNKPFSHTPSSTWKCATTDTSISKSAKSPRMSQSNNAHNKYINTKKERTLNLTNAPSSKTKSRRSSHSSDGSNSQRSQKSECRTPQKEIKCSTPNSKSRARGETNFKIPPESCLSESGESDVDIESVTPGKEAIPSLLRAGDRSDVTKRLFQSQKGANNIKSESKSDFKVKKDSKSDKNRNISKSLNKSKEKTKERTQRRKSSTECSEFNQEKECSNVSKVSQRRTSASSTRKSKTCSDGIEVNSSIEKDVGNIFNEIGSENLNLLSPIPHPPEKSNVYNSSKFPSNTAPKPVKNKSVPKFLSYDKTGKPSLMVRIDMSLLPKNCELMRVKNEKVATSPPSKCQPELPHIPVIGNSDNENTTEYVDSDMELDSPDSTFLIELPLENCVKRDYIPPDTNIQSTVDNRVSIIASHSSPASNHSPRHRKSFKRKQDSDRVDDIKRAKSVKNTYQNNDIGFPEKEKESHKNSREWDRKHPRRSDVKERRDSSSSVSSQSGPVRHTKTQGTEPEQTQVKVEVKADVEEKVDDLVVHDQTGARYTSSNGYPSSNEMHPSANGYPSSNEMHPSANGYPSSNEMQNWLREGDRDGDEILPSPRPQRQRPEDRLESADTYLAEAKKLKHQADNLNDKPTKMLTYLEAVLSFIQCGYAMEKEAISEISKIHQMYQDTYRLVSCIFRSRSNHDCNHNMTLKERILAVLSLRIQSLLCLKLFKLRKTETLKLKRAIEDHNKPSSKPPTHAPSPHQSNWNSRSSINPQSHSSPTPSPAGSIGSVDSQGSDLIPSKLANGNAASSVTTSMSSPAPGVVSVPQRIHSLTQQYINMTNYLVRCHDYWDQADTAMQEYQGFFEELDDQCGALTLHSGIMDLVFYIQSGLHQLRSR